MRRMLLTSAAVIGLAVAMPALAQAAGGSTAGNAQDNESAAQMSAGTPVQDRPDTQMNTGEATTGAASQQNAAATDAEINSYRYMSANPDYADQLAGTTIGGGYAADELLGANVVNDSGETIGTIEDLLVADGQAQLAILDLGDNAGVDKQYTAIAVDALQPSQGGEGDFVTSLSASEIQQLEAYEQQSDGSWEEVHLN